MFATEQLFEDQMILSRVEGCSLAKHLSYRNTYYWPAKQDSKCTFPQKFFTWRANLFFAINDEVHNLCGVGRASDVEAVKDADDFSRQRIELRRAGGLSGWGRMKPPTPMQKTGFNFPTVDEARRDMGPEITEHEAATRDHANVVVATKDRLYAGAYEEKYGVQSQTHAELLASAAELERVMRTSLPPKNRVLGAGVPKHFNKFTDLIPFSQWKYMHHNLYNGHRADTFRANKSRSPMAPVARQQGVTTFSHVACPISPTYARCMIASSRRHAI
jgi:hypothetical protein